VWQQCQPVRIISTRWGWAQSQGIELLLLLLLLLLLWGTSDTAAASSSSQAGSFCCPHSSSVP
jgi:hypothetical protein